NPKPIAFFNIPGNVDIAVKGNTMYADFGGGLAVIDITDPANPVLKNLMSSVFYKSTDFPTNISSTDGKTIYFECVDTTRGVVIGWEHTSLENPKCFR